jgi:hypothetical protein
VANACALRAEPGLLVCDEIPSVLDAPGQVRAFDQLSALQRRAVVMRAGCCPGQGDTARVFHASAQALRFPVADCPPGATRMPEPVLAAK